MFKVDPRDKKWLFVLQIDARTQKVYEENVTIESIEQNPKDNALQANEEGDAIQIRERGSEEVQEVHEEETEDFEQG